MDRIPERMKILPLGSVSPEGWLKDQMSLVNDLQKRLGADSTLTGGGKWTGGEAFPRYVRGLCLLAGALRDAQLTEKAKSFMTAIFDSAEPGGDFGGQGCTLPAKIEAVKAVLTYHELTGDEKALSFLRKFFKNQFNTLSVTPMFYDGRARLPEELPAIAAVCGDTLWLKELAVKLAGLSCNWQRIADRFPYKYSFGRTISARAAKRVVSSVREFEELKGKKRAKLFTAAKADAEWKKPSHRVVVEADGVNIAKAVKYPCLFDSFFGYAGRENLSLRLAGALERYHGNATGMFSSSPKLGGLSPVSGMDVEGAGEFVESLSEVLAATGECACADIMEEIVYNVMGGAATEDLAAVRDVIPANRADADASEPSARYPHGAAYVKGLPSRGALALLAVYPVFLRSVCLTRENELNFFSYAPCTVRTTANGGELRIKLDTGYPFRNTVVFRVEAAEGDVSVAINFRVPHRTTMQLVSGGQVVATGEHNISVKCILRTGSTFMLRMNIPLTPSANRDGTVSFYKGSLLMASKPGEEYRTDAKDAHAVAAYPTGRWAFAPVLTKRMLGSKLSLPDNERTVVGQFTAHPYSHSSPPFALRIVCRNAVNWECDEHGRPALPAQTKFAEESSERVFVPYGCTATGMTHFPVCH